MFLKYIRADGFKSFADKTEIEVNPGITCVVGPNGSGKSNIVDAIRWVLGEQSVKALRGDNSMCDVIFSGSKSRKENNRAIVSLTFDNNDKYLNTEFKEVEIKRVLYKTGENEYYINNTKVRLKDITDLFLDTGASKESFNIISQGAIADIINSKPESRRIIFEEAAGVLKYKKRKELERKDIALIANNLTNINNEYQTVKTNVERLNKDLDNLSNSYSNDDSELEKLKLESIRIDESIENKNKDIMMLVKQLSDLQSEKQITIERQKYQVDDQKLENNIIALKEDILSIQNSIEIANKEMDEFKIKLKSENLEKIDLHKRLQQIDKEKLFNQNSLNALNKEILQLSNRIDIINDNLNNDTKLPFAVKAIIDNVRLTGVHGVLSKLLEVDDKYSNAIEVVLGANCNIVVVDNEDSAKNAINYLKDNKLGRATFYPLNIIKARFLDKDIINKVVNDKGYLGVASDLIKYDKKYRNVFSNLLGNVIVVDNIDSMNRIGKLIDYKYRVVSLDGDILYSGGAISGGIAKTGRLK